MSTRGRQLERVIQTRDQSPVRKPIVTVLRDEDIQSAIYFDNAYRHLEEVGKACSNIVLINVKETEQPEYVDIDTSFPMRYFLKRLGTNLYIDQLREQARQEAIIAGRPAESAKVYVKYDFVAGIREEHLEQLRRWLEANQNTPGQKAVIFDWDRTLTKVEGIPDVEGRKAINESKEHFVSPELLALREDMLRFVMGGPERLQALRDTFALIDRYGAKIFILTNNGACGERQFFEWVKQLIFPIPFRIVCSRPFQGDKGKTLSNDQSFKMICVSH